MWVSCSKAPSWLAEAPTLGAYFENIDGRKVYIPFPPQRVALLSEKAHTLWRRAGLDTYVYGCAGMGSPEKYFLPCDAYYPERIYDALMSLRPQWVWADTNVTLPDSLPFPTLIWEPKNVQSWIQMLGDLGALYDHRPAIHLADSLRRKWQTWSERVKKEYVYQVLIAYRLQPLICAGGSNPLSDLIQAAGGKNPYDTVPQFYFYPPIDSLSTNVEFLLIPASQAGAYNTFLAENPNLLATKFVQYKRVFAVADSILMAPMRDPMHTYEVLLRILHPEVVSL
ncbi:MAG: ABC transporter substrate-binding protein [Bacteroidia bacterium]